MGPFGWHNDLLIRHWWQTLKGRKGFHTILPMLHNKPVSLGGADVYVAISQGWPRLFRGFGLIPETISRTRRLALERSVEGQSSVLNSGLSLLNHVFFEAVTSGPDRLPSGEAMSDLVESFSQKKRLHSHSTWIIFWDLSTNFSKCFTGSRKQEKYFKAHSLSLVVTMAEP